MVKFERSKVPRITAGHALTTHFHQKFDLPGSAALQLLNVALVMKIRVFVLADPRAKSRLFAA